MASVVVTSLASGKTISEEPNLSLTEAIELAEDIKYTAETGQHITIYTDAGTLYSGTYAGDFDLIDA